MTPNTDEELIAAARALLNSDHTRNECPARYAECTCGWSADLELKAAALGGRLAGRGGGENERQARQDRLIDSAFAAGLGAGWNYCVADDREGLNRAKESRIVGHRAEIAKAVELDRASLSREREGWRDIEFLSMPRNEAGAPVDPVLDVLSFAAKPWVLQSIAMSLRGGGLNIPTRAEAEMAAALHFLISHAMKSGALWWESARVDLNARLEHAKRPAPPSQGGETPEAGG